MIRKFGEMFGAIVSAPRRATAGSIELGRSKGDRPIVGYRFGNGAAKISLIAGCHADEPVGPAFLDRLSAYLSYAPKDSEIITRFQWWIVPHMNPDGAARNKTWTATDGGRYQLLDYLSNVVRELPGDDIEFGFPRDEDDSNARPENRAVYDWWRSDPEPFALHASLHGMAFAGGPWFLIDPDWVDRCEIVKRRCRDAAARLGYRLHDVERNGEKGFVRIERGFCTRPNSNAMSRYFVERDDPATAALFRPSSMETIRSHGSDPLTLVSEVPLFVVPRMGDTITPSDPVADNWHATISRWRARLDNGEAAEGIVDEIADSGVSPVPIRDQMALQWAFVTAGIEQMASSAGRSPG